MGPFRLLDGNYWIKTDRITKRDLHISAFGLTDSLMDFSYFQPLDFYHAHASKALSQRILVQAVFQSAFVQLALPAKTESHLADCMLSCSIADHHLQILLCI